MLSKSSVTSSSTCFLFALTVFCVNVQHFSSNGVHWNFIFRAYQALIFLIGCEHKWFVLPERAIAATSFSIHLFNIWTFLCISTRQCPGSPCSQNGSLLLSAETPDFIGLQYCIRKKADTLNIRF